VNIDRFVIGLAAVFLIGCGSGSSNTMTGPTTLSMAGSWTGTLKLPSSTSPYAVAWMATQSGTAVTGPLVIKAADNGRDVAATLAGTVSETNAALMLTVATGGVIGAPACSFGGTGTATPSAGTSHTPTAVGAIMNLTFVAACSGTVSTGATDTGQLVLSR